MSTPSPPLLDPFQQPPPMVMAELQQAYKAQSGHGSIGPVIAVLAVIVILGAIAVMIGRLCSGRGFMGRGGHYDFERWVETKCSSCIDGRVDTPIPPLRRVVERTSSSGSGDGPPPPATVSAAPAAEEGEQEMKEEEEAPEDQHRRHSHGRVES